MSQRSRLLDDRDSLEGLVPPMVPRASEETAIYDLTNICYDAFERLTDADPISILHNDDDSGATPHDLPGLKNIFAFWVDYIGALAPIGASLDDRLADHIDIKEMIIQLLEMVKRNIDQLERLGADHSSKSSDWNQSLLSIGAALDRLHFLASAIRKASIKSTSGEEILLNFVTEEEILSKNTFISYVNWRFPKARKSLREHLGSTIAIRRKILSKRVQHDEKLAIGRTDLKPTPLQAEEQGQSIEPMGPTQLLGIPSVMKEKDTLPKRLGAMTELTQASELNLDLAIKHINQKKPVSSIMSSGTSTRDDSLAQRYPSLPKLASDTTHALCPYCGGPFRSGEPSGSRAVLFWENHVDRDLQPYSCLFPQCLGAFFTHRSDWAQHMKTTHGENWPRNVHCVTWFCDIGHPDIAEFDNEIEWRAHMRNIESHPGRKKQPTDIQLQALAIKKRHVALRDEHVCPLCEEIPEEISVLGDKGNRNELFEILEDHIARHIKDVSFMSLPTLNDEPKDEVGRDATTPGGLRGQLSRIGSAPHPPGPSELMENVSLTFSSSKDSLYHHSAPGPTTYSPNLPDLAKGVLLTFAALGSFREQPLNFDSVPYSLNLSEWVEDVSSALADAQTPDSEPDSMVPDNPCSDTESKYSCCQCSDIDYFTYTASEDDASEDDASEDDACCKNCAHRKCEECKEED